jgi:hypothetical protein
LALNQNGAGMRLSFFDLIDGKLFI